MRKLLEVLNCPLVDKLPSSLSEMEVKDQVQLVCWLEDRVIRELDIASRTRIRPNQTDCVDQVAVYLKGLGCPFPWNHDSAFNLEALHWAISFAINCQYEDDVGDAMEQEDGGEEERLSVDKLKQQASINEEITKHLNRLGSLLGESRQSEERNTDYLQRIIEKVKQSNRSGGGGEQHAVTLSDLPLGFSSGDEIVDTVAKVLRLLHVSELRILQDQVNDLLALCQESTANPRLNASLGKVGR
eukprot:gene1901-2079_t